MTNNLEQIKTLIKQGLGSVAVRMITKDIQEGFDSIDKKSVYPKTKTTIYIKSEAFEVLNILRNGILVSVNGEAKLPVFYSYEDIAPIQLWLLAYVIIPKVIRKETDHEIIPSSDNDE